MLKSRHAHIFYYHNHLKSITWHASRYHFFFTMPNIISICFATTSTQNGFSLGWGLLPVLEPGRTIPVEVLGRGTLLHRGPGLYLRGSVLAGLFAPVLLGVGIVTVLLVPLLEGFAESSVGRGGFVVLSDVVSLLAFVLVSLAPSLCTGATVFSDFLSELFDCSTVLSLFTVDSASFFSINFSVAFSVLLSLHLGDFSSFPVDFVAFGGDDFSSLESVLRLLRGTSVN